MTAPPARCIGIIAHVALIGHMALAARIDGYGVNYFGSKDSSLPGNPDAISNKAYVCAFIHNSCGIDAKQHEGKCECSRASRR